MSKPILCIDFDGVVHSYASGWKGATVIPDPPVPGALKWLWKATEWFDVQIYSSRSKDAPARMAMKIWMCTHAGDIWDSTHPMCDPTDDYPITFAHEKPAAFLTIDDRALCFDGDWSGPELEPADLLNFKPWNKRQAPKLGATGAFPDGKLHKDDEGELRFGVARGNDGLVHINFGKEVSWFAMPPNDAKAFAAMLLKHAGGSAQN